MLRARFAAIVVPLIPLVSGCGAGCSDVAVSDTVRVRLDAQTMGDDHLLHVELCQDGSCSEIDTPAGEAVMTLSVRELSPASDLEMPGEITAEVTDASGRVDGSTSAPFDFEDYTAEGGCESALSQVITVQASRAPG